MSAGDTNLLMDLLEAGLLPVGDNDEHVARLERASASLAEELTHAPEKAIAAVLVGLDAEAEPDEPAFAQAEEHVRREWKTLRNAHPDRPRVLLRAVILEACRQASESPRIAGVVLMTALGPLHAGLVRMGREQDAVRRLLLALSHRLEREIVARSDGRAVAQIPALSTGGATPPKAQVSKIASDDVLLRVVAAAGPHDANSKAGPNPNPHWPNQGTPWSYEFAPRMTQALVQAVNLGIERTLQSIQQQAELDRAWVTERLSEHAAYLKNLADALGAQQPSHQIRLDVLWWQEALYSPTLQQSYRALSPVAAAVAMAHDLHRFAPPLAPASLAYVLSEATARLPGAGHGERVPLLELLARLTEAPQLRELVAPPTALHGRAPLLHLVEAAAHGAPSTTASLRAHTGFSTEAAVDLPTLAMWCFRDLQARRLARSPA